MFYAILLTLAVGVDASYEWRSFKDGTQDYALIENGHQVGAYDAAKGVYRPYDRVRDKWLPACPAPIDPPYRNYGVRMSETEKGTHYRRGGVEISQDEADAVLQGTLPLLGDPADKRKRLVIIGSDEDRLSVMMALMEEEDLKALQKDYVVQGFAPDAWQVARSGFVVDGKPTIYFMEADGKVLYRRDDFDCGAKGLAEALRDADPDYKPESDPGPANPLADVNNPTTAMMLGACLAFAVALALFIWGCYRWRISLPSARP